MSVKMIILRLLSSSDDKEKICVARTRIEETVKKFNTPVEPMIRKRHTPVELSRSWKLKIHSPVKPTLKKMHTSVHCQIKVRKNTYTG